MITVICVDDHPLIREAVKSLIEKETDIKLVAEGSTGHDIPLLIKKHQPDVAILDLNLPVEPTFSVLGEIRRITTETKTRVIVLSQQDAKPVITGVMSRGAKGFLVKSDNLSVTICAGIRVVAAKGLYLSETATRQYLGSSSIQDVDLSARHLEILQTVARYPDHSYEYHAGLLNISEGTLRNHIGRLFRALDVSNMTAAIIRAMEIGVLDIQTLRQQHEPSNGI